MPSYWWECAVCRISSDFADIANSKGIQHFIWDVLLPSEWDQRYLIKKCNYCNNNSLYITYQFPRKDPVKLHVKHIVGLGPFDGGYLPMLWETFEDVNPSKPLIDFKYIIHRSIYGLNRPAVFTKQELNDIFDLYRTLTGETIF